jgi:hypothetical protein
LSRSKPSISYLGGLGCSLLERFPLTVDKFHPGQLKMAIGEGQEAVKMATLGKVEEQWTGQSKVTDDGQENKFGEVRDTKGLAGIQGQKEDDCVNG